MRSEHDEALEVAATLERLREALDAVLVRGLRAAGAGELAALALSRDVVAASGAPALAASLDASIEAVRAGSREAPRSMLRVRAGVRLFERLLTLRVVEQSFVRALEEAPDAAGAEAPERSTAHDAGGAASTSTGLDAAERARCLHVLGAIAAAIEELLLSGLTTASGATEEQLAVGFREASRARLLRLGGSLRIVLEELKRFGADAGAFAPERLAFFLDRSWLLARAMSDALARGDDAAWSALARTPPSERIPLLDAVVLGVFKRHVPGAFSAFELRLRAIAEAGSVRAGDGLVLSFVFPSKAGANVPPEAFLLLEQPPRPPGPAAGVPASGATYRPSELLTGRAARFADVAITRDSSTRLVVGPDSRVTLGEAFAGWSAFARWDRRRALERLRAHAPDPTTLPVELAEEVVLAAWTLAPWRAREGKPWQSAEVIADGLCFELRADSPRLAEALREAHARTPRPALFGFVHYEGCRLVLTPLALLPAGAAPELCTLEATAFDRVALAKALAGR